VVRADQFHRDKLLKFGTQPVSIGGGVRYWAESPDTGAPRRYDRHVLRTRRGFHWLVSPP
jgi:hypothetical protein